jgi:NTE family protein
MYALHGNAEWVEKRFKKVLAKNFNSNIFIKYLSSSSEKKSFFGNAKLFIFEHFLQIIKLHKKSIISRNTLKKVISDLVPVESFEDLKIPLKVCATELNSGKNITYDSGDLITAIVSSCSIPGIIEPTIQNKNIIVDGGVFLPIPVQALRDKCNFTIAVDISQNKLSILKKVNMKNLKGRSDLITSNHLKNLLSKQADFILKPNTLGSHWSNFNKSDLLIREGEIEVKNKIDNLKEILTKVKFIDKRKERLS